MPLPLFRCMFYRGSHKVNVKSQRTARSHRCGRRSAFENGGVRANPPLEGELCRPRDGEGCAGTEDPIGKQKKISPTPTATTSRDAHAPRYLHQIWIHTFHKLMVRFLGWSSWHLVLACAEYDAYRFLYGDMKTWNELTRTFYISAYIYFVKKRSREVKGVYAFLFHPLTDNICSHIFAYWLLIGGMRTFLEQFSPWSRTSLV